MIHTIIIGGGASGMVAAIAAGRKYFGTDKEILILEQKDRLGKKVLATGNGKCNYTNADMNLSNFYGDPSLISSVYGRFDLEQVLAFFRELGIYPRSRGGYYYPYSEQAASLVWALETEIRRLGISIRTKESVTDIAKNRKGFLVTTGKDTYLCRNLIIACGLKASPKLGSDGSLIPILKKLGHHMRPVVPSLCGFRCSGMDFKKAAGVRTEGVISVYSGGRLLKADTGELQFTEYGLSGIPVFQVSHPVSLMLHHRTPCEFRLNLLPGFTRKQLEAELLRRKSRNAAFSAESLLMGLLPQKLIEPILSASGISVNSKVSGIDDRRLSGLADHLFAFSVIPEQVRDFEYAQVCAGGIPAEEVTKDTLASRIVPGLYFAGEVLDVDGICGGYNLQWAWSSGFLAGSQV